MEIEFDFNVPADLLENKATDTFITVKAKAVFTYVDVWVVKMQGYIFASLVAPVQLWYLLERTAKEKLLEKGLLLKSKTQQWDEYIRGGGTMTMKEWETDGRFDRSLAGVEPIYNQEEVEELESFHHCV